MPLQIEHIKPLVAGGTSERSNLWPACPLCNGHKASRTHAPDPTTGLKTALFNPREQKWDEHFQWSEDGIMIIGLTATGRATVDALQLNNDHLTRARRRWVSVGWHPPKP